MQRLLLVQFLRFVRIRRVLNVGTLVGALRSGVAPDAAPVMNADPFSNVAAIF